MVYYTGPNRKVTRSNVSNVSNVSNSTPMPSSVPSSSSGLSKNQKIWLGVGIAGVSILIIILLCMWLKKKE